MNKKIIIYTSPTCHFCHEAKAFFKEKGLDFTEYNVAENREKLQEMVDQTGQMGVPVIQIEEEFFIGFNRPLVEQMLEK